EAATNYSGGPNRDHAVHRLRQAGSSSRPKIARARRRLRFRFDSTAASLGRIALAQDSARKTTPRKGNAQDRAPRRDEGLHTTVTRDTTLKFLAFLCILCGLCARVRCGCTNTR